MKTTFLGFTSVISFGIALAPLLVQTPEPLSPRGTAPAASERSDATAWLQACGLEVKSHAVTPDCFSGARIADMR
jgi:hypothetical protein